MAGALHSIDPRRSLAAGAIWLIVALAVTFSTAAAIWVGRIARHNVIEQHVRRLSLETDQLSSDLGQALAARLGALRAARSLLRGPGGTGRGRLSDLFEELTSAYPELGWVAIAGADGVLAATRELAPGSAVASATWFRAGLRGPWLGIIEPGAAPQVPDRLSFGDVALPVQDDAGTVVGVIAAHLSLRRAPHHPQRLTDESDPRSAAQAFVLDRDGVVLMGPDGARGRRWDGIPASGIASDGLGPHFEQLPGGRRVLVARAPVSTGGGAELGWQAQLSEPNERVYQRADALALQILWVSLGLGAATALLGTLAARQLTARLQRLTQSVASVGRSEVDRIEVPGGQDEVARLAGAFAAIHEDLQRERRELTDLSSELERRVAVRTREVERLAEESRYAAIVRERLTIARDLHDTLAHSMMAMLSEVRYLRKLHARDPGSLAQELARAEQVAQEGLNEARSAITQMRVNAVRETGLGPALSQLFGRFIDRTGLAGEFTAAAEAASFGDERAETLLRMAQEALRNVERHARATRVAMALSVSNGDRLQLRIEDNGVGFDPGSPSPGHYGLVGLREQADMIGAELAIDSTPNGGTKLTVALRVSPMTFGA